MPSTSRPAAANSILLKKKSTTFTNRGLSGALRGASTSSRACADLNRRRTIPIPTGLQSNSPAILTILRLKEFAKLRWVRDSGPLSCEFLPAQLDCSSGGSDPKREIKMQTRLQHPYGILWPLSPFSFTGIARQVERDRASPTRVDLVRIEQPGMANPVQAMVLEGPLQYVGDENIEIAGRKWLAHNSRSRCPSIRNS